MAEISKINGMTLKDTAGRAEAKAYTDRRIQTVYESIGATIGDVQNACKAGSKVFRHRITLDLDGVYYVLSDIYTKSNGQMNKQALSDYFGENPVLAIKTPEYTFATVCFNGTSIDLNGEGVQDSTAFDDVIEL